MVPASEPSMLGRCNNVCEKVYMDKLYIHIVLDISVGAVAKRALTPNDYE